MRVALDGREARVVEENRICSLFNAIHEELVLGWVNVVVVVIEKRTHSKEGCALQSNADYAPSDDETEDGDGTITHGDGGSASWFATGAGFGLVCLGFGDKLVLAGSAWSSACSRSGSGTGCCSCRHGLGTGLCNLLRRKVTLGSDVVQQSLGFLEVLLKDHVGVLSLVASCDVE